MLSFTSRLSNFLDRNEILDVRDQIFKKLRVNSRAIYRDWLEIWADQPILQSLHDKSDSLLARDLSIVSANNTICNSTTLGASIGASQSSQLLWWFKTASAAGHNMLYRSNNAAWSAVN
ncbi:MAG: hypothetical protein GY816_12850 [Cytophagales bacterium]|nr:hypothetical protein [Cytophagales bacterium]